MDEPLTGDAPAISWASVDACTLPTADRPLRVAAFDDLFAASLCSTEHVSETKVRMLLSGDSNLARRVQDLVVAESSCCSFFSFAVAEPEDGMVALDIRVPAAYVEVLQGLTGRAEAAMATPR